MIFCWKIQKIHTVCLQGQSAKHGQLGDSKVGTEMPDMCGQVAGSSKLLNDFLAQSKGLGSQTGTKNAFFPAFLILLGPNYS